MAVWDENHGKHNDLLENARFDIYDGISPAFDPNPLHNCPERICATRADYSGGTGKVSVYHFLVHMGDQ